jgi:hypothetical protein
MLIHVYSDYDRRTAGTIGRHNMARKTWQDEYANGQWKPLPIHDRDFQRNSNSVGERKIVPFVRDLIDKGHAAMKPDDILVLTNDDVCFVPGLTETIVEQVNTFGATYSSRWEFPTITRTLQASEVFEGYKHCGADLFAWKLQWWQKWGENFGDFLLSFEAWDLVMRRIIKNLSGGSELVAGIVHASHEPAWHTPETRECRGNLYNRAIAQAFLAKHQLPWLDQ